MGTGGDENLGNKLSWPYEFVLYVDELTAIMFYLHMLLLTIVKHSERCTWHVYIYYTRCSISCSLIG